MTFDDVFRRRLDDLMLRRRDVRRFRSDPLPVGILEGLIESACLAPSVGLCQSRRFVIVDDPVRRKNVIDEFRACNSEALKIGPAPRTAATRETHPGRGSGALSTTTAHIRWLFDTYCRTDA